MRLLNFILVAGFMLLSFRAGAQGWKWGSENSFSTVEPFQDNWLCATDKSGNLLTVSTMGSQQFVATLAGVVSHLGTFSIVDSFNTAQMLVAKIDTGGNYLWAIGTEGPDVSCSNIATDNAGNVYVLAIYDSSELRIGTQTLLNPPYYGNQRYMYFIVKYNTDGVFQWATNVAPTIVVAAIDDVSFPQGTIGADAAGNVYVGGVFIDSVITIGGSTLLNNNYNPSIYHFNADLFLAKFNASGSPVWARGFAQIADGQNQLCESVTADGDIYLSGMWDSTTIVFGSDTLSSPVTHFGLFLARFDADGNTKWAKGTPWYYDDAINGQSMDLNNNIYLIGYFSDDTVNFGGKMITTLFPGYTDMFLVKYDSSGNTHWAISGGGDGNANGYSVSVDDSGKVWALGTFPGYYYNAGTSIILGTGVITEAGGAEYDDLLFIAEFDTAGNFKTGLQVNSGGDDPSAITVDNRGGFYLCGDWLSGTEGFGKDTLYQVPANEVSFIARYVFDTGYHFKKNGLPVAAPASAEVLLFPNPASDEYTISCETGFSPGSRAVLYDLTGRQVRTLLLTGTTNTFSLSGIAPGVYQCNISPGDETRMITKKLVVMK